MLLFLAHRDIVYTTGSQLGWLVGW